MLTVYRRSRGVESGAVAITPAMLGRVRSCRAAESGNAHGGNHTATPANSSPAELSASRVAA
jgi:hypothetical protein